MTTTPIGADATTWWHDLRLELGDELAGLRVAVYGSGGSPYHHAALAALWGADVTPLGATAIRDGGLAGVDAIIFPGGGARAMGGMLEPLGTDGAAAVREWVAQGGMYVGSCAGSFLPAIVGDAYWGAHPESRAMHMVCARLSNSSDSEWEGLTSPGVGALDVELAERGHWLADGLPERFRLVHYNGPMFLPHASVSDDARLGGTQGVVRFRARTAGFTPSDAFMDPGTTTATVFDRGVAEGAFTAITAAFGEGTVVLFGSHPEFGFDAIQLGWGEGSRLYANALRHQAARRRARPRARPTTANAAADAGGGNAAASEALRELAPRFEALAGRFARLGGDTPFPWLQQGCVAGFMGLTPEQVWRDALARAAEVSEATGRYLEELAGSGGSGLGQAWTWIDEAAPSGQDYGFTGLRQLADAMERAIDEATKTLEGEPFCLEHPYDALDRHPYQMLASTYLSAAGLAACAALASSVIGARAGRLEHAPVGPTSDPVARA